MNRMRLRQRGVPRVSGAFFRSLLSDKTKSLPGSVRYLVSKRIPSVFGPQWQEIVQLAFVMWIS